MQPDAESHPALSVEENESSRARIWRRLLSHIRLLFSLVCCMLLSFSLALISLEGAFRPFLQQIVNAAHLALVAIVLLLYPLLLIAHLKGHVFRCCRTLTLFLVERAGGRGPASRWPVSVMGAWCAGCASAAASILARCSCC